MAIIRPKPLAPKTFYRGETFRGRLAVVNTDLTIKDLTDADVRWALLSGPAIFALPELSIGFGIEFEEGNPALGVLIVTLFDETTDSLFAGTYQQEWHITDNIGDVGVYRGQVFVTDASLWGDRMTTLEVEITGSLKAYMASEAAAVVAGARAATKRQTEETKNAARAIVNAGLTGSRQFRTGNRRAAQTIRSRFYEDSPAGVVHSTWGYFEGGRFVDILAVHTTGATITPKRGRYLFIPFVGAGQRRSRRQSQRLDSEKVDIIPLPNGQKLVVTRERGQRKGLVLGLLTRQVRIPKRLDFTGIERDALTGLEAKTVVEIDLAARKLR